MRATSCVAGASTAHRHHMRSETDIQSEIASSQRPTGTDEDRDGLLRAVAVTVRPQRAWSRGAESRRVNPCGTHCCGAAFCWRRSGAAKRTPKVSRRTVPPGCPARRVLEEPRREAAGRVLEVRDRRREERLRATPGPPVAAATPAEPHPPPEEMAGRQEHLGPTDARRSTDQPRETWSPTGRCSSMCGRVVSTKPGTSKAQSMCLSSRSQAGSTSFPLPVRSSSTANREAVPHRPPPSCVTLGYTC